MQFEGEYLPNNIKKGKFYEKGDLVFEGEANEYNCRINGYGKEYWNNKLVFKGTYKNWKKTGHLKEYDTGGDFQPLAFEGEIKDDIRNGKGKEYINGQLKFEGEFLDGKRWNGKIHNPNDNSVYEIKNGNGIIVDYENEDCLFDGELKDGERYNGKVKEDYFEDSCHYNFEGFYINGIKKGKEYAEGELIYDGEKEGDLYNGKGAEYYKGEKTFEGEFRNGKKWNGKGKSFEYNEFGKKVVEYEGEFLEGKWHGKGREFDNGEEIFRGEYKNGKRWTGKGKEYKGTFEKKLIYEGTYFEGKRMKGKGEEYDDEGKLIFKGKYLEGKRWNGKGKEFDNSGKVIFDGEYVNGKKKEEKKKKK